VALVESLTDRVALVPFLTHEPIGEQRLAALVDTTEAEPAPTP
jgi:hypothetical protein